MGNRESQEPGRLAPFPGNSEGGPLQHCRACVSAEMWAGNLELLSPTLWVLFKGVIGHSERKERQKVGTNSVRKK